MKFHPLLLILLLFPCCVLLAQQKPTNKIYLAGSVIFSTPLDEGQLDEFNTRRSADPKISILQFERVVTVSQRQFLSGKGIEILEYIPDNAYTVLIRSALNFRDLKQAGVFSMVDLKPEQKMQPALSRGVIPSWAVIVPGTVDCWISFPLVIPVEKVKAELLRLNVQVTDDKYKHYRILAIRIPVARLKEVAASGYIDYIQPAPGRDQLLNANSRSNTNARLLNDAAGRNLTGSGVVIGVGDDSDPMQHIDYSSRIINRSPAINGFHGVHVIGTITGAGIVQEKNTGFAPRSTVVAQAFSNILTLAPAYVADNGMVITNNSYGNVANDCTSFGMYDLYSRVTDQQMLDLPNLQHVFAVGNSGFYSCAYPAGYGTVLGAYQSSKNVITVGNGTVYGYLNGESSKGPTKDGRIKPEISAQGTSVTSTGPGNGYFPYSGTSMAAPAVSGGLALLYQRYRQLNGNSNPRNSLMKALLLNGATSKNDAGPDYIYGYGWMNLLRSVRMLEQQNYVESAISQSGTNIHTLVVPPGSNLALIKVMIYWNDPAASALSAHSLVNDLDLEVTTPSSVVAYPQLLDSTRANVANASTTGADHINNAEQVLLASPADGTYTFTVKGFNITTGGPQPYTLVYDTIPFSTRLTYPAAGDHLNVNEGTFVSWDSYGFNGNTFTLQFSADNGVTWTDAVTGISAMDRIVPWTTPTVQTDQARLKIIHNGTGIEDISGTFTILGIPVLTASSVQCPGYASLQWTAVPGATDYEVMQMRGDSMQQVAVINATTYTISGLAPDSLYWFSVRARLNGKPGFRAVALSRQPSTGACTGAISNNDLRLVSVVSPVLSGRLFTSTAFGPATVVRVKIRNLDDVTANNPLSISYRVNGGTWISEIINAPLINAGAEKEFAFSATADFSVVGTYNVQVALSYSGDPVTVNDSAGIVVRQLDNAPINLATDHVDDFEMMPVKEYGGAVRGLDNADRFDFSTSTGFGRARSFVNTGIAIGNRGITLDSRRFNSGGTIDTLFATYNLGGYNVSVDDVRLDFQLKHHGQFDHPANRCWIRGSDTQPWIQILDLVTAQGDAGVFKRTPSIELGDLLAAAGQQFSSSTQVRWAQFGQHLTADNIEVAGYTLDDIKLYRVSNDIQMVKLDSPVVSGCGLNNMVPVKITVRNSSATVITSIPVRYQVDGGPVVTGNIPSIGADASVLYTFTITADLSAVGAHQVLVWNDLPSDSYRLNDTVRVTVYNSPVVSSFPYLQDFESGNGSWYTAGQKSSWQYGTPASVRINTAASGSRAWKTSLAGTYNDGEFSYLYSPCFDLAGMTRPTISLSIALDLEDCGTGFCDGAWIEYTTDGLSWAVLGASGTGTNWYNRVYGGDGVWSVEDYTRWHVATNEIPLGADLSRVRFRIVVKADPFVAREGIAIDDIHVYDNIKGIYSGGSGSPEILQASVSGSSWIDFESGGQLVASVNPMGSNLGNTSARAYINTAGARWNATQYYHNRNITIKPASITPGGPVKVRFYFLDIETESLINATGCAGCAKPSSAYQLGVSKYSDINDAVENGTIADNAGGNWIYLLPASVRKVPFDRGYYAEFDVNNFSEFWLNNGGLTANQALPVQLLSFTAKKSINGANVLLDWTSSSEQDLLKYVVEVTYTADGFARNIITVLHELATVGNSNSAQQYSFTDNELGKAGVRYYRLRMVDRDGHVTYSAVKPVIFRNDLKWSVYPNPSSGQFNVVYQADAGEQVLVRIHDLNGRLVTESRFVASGFLQKGTVDLRSATYAPGIYMCEVIAGERKDKFTLYKQ